MTQLYFLWRTGSYETILQVGRSYINVIYLPVRCTLHPSQHTDLLGKVFLIPKMMQSSLMITPMSSACQLGHRKDSNHGAVRWVTARLQSCVKSELI